MSITTIGRHYISPHRTVNLLKILHRKLYLMGKFVICLSDTKKIAIKLIRRGADIDALDVDDDSPLNVAAYNGLLIKCLFAMVIFKSINFRK